MGFFENWAFETLMISMVLIAVLLGLGKAILKITELVNIVNVLIKMQYKYVELLKELEKKSINIEASADNTLKNQTKHFERQNILFSALTRQIRALEKLSSTTRSQESKLERNSIESQIASSDKTRGNRSSNQSQNTTGSRLTRSENNENNATVPLAKFLERQMETKSPSDDENNKVVTLSSLFENKNIHKLFPQSAKKRSAVNG